jgi:hypothetical protein
LYTNVQAARSMMHRVAGLMNKAATQNEFLCGRRRFRRFAGLTGFPSARNIVRIRTKWSGRGSAVVIGAPNEQACSR